MENDDIKSTSSSPVGETLEQKHNRLLAEFSKVRAQLTVLKNVVVEEKSVTTELKNQMRQKDQNIRRLEQETESLRFCNGQMQSRLLVLQKDLKEKDSKSKNNKKKEPAYNDCPSSTAEELSADFVQLVEINAHLSSKLSSVQCEMESTVKAMEQKLLQAIASERSATETLTEFRARYNTMEEKIRIEAEASSRKEMSELKSRVFDLKTENTELRAELDEAKRRIDILDQASVNMAEQSEFSNKLNQQLSSQADQLIRLQQEKERWMLDAQILKLRNVNSSKEIAIAPLQSTDSVDSQPSSSSESFDDTVNRTPVQDQLRIRINTLISDLQYSDGKAFYFQAECSALSLRLQMAEECRNKVDQRLSDAQNHIDDLKKQLETTVNQTSEQLAVLSEHLVTMNEKLQVKTDEINMLKYELQQRVPVSKQNGRSHR